MHVRLGITVALVALFGLALGSSLFLSPANAAGCPGGTVPITSEARAAATAAGIPTSADCWNPQDGVVGQAAGADKLFLKEHATNVANISCLDADFAKKLRSLMEAVPGGIPTITDSYRTPQAQENARASGASHVGACGSHHQYGIAADFNNSSRATLLWMRQNAPRFGLTHLPAMDVFTGCSKRGSGFCDPGHIQLAIALPSRNQCVVCSSSAGDGLLPPSAGRSGPPFDNTLRRLLAPQAPPPPVARPQSPAATQPTLAVPPPLGAVNTTALPPEICAPQFHCVGDVNYYRASTCVDQVYQTCANGCSGGACVGSSTPSVENVNTNTNTNENGTTTAYDFIAQFANPAATSATATVTPIALNPNTSDAQLLEPPSPSGGIYAGGAVSVQPSSSGGTFVSADLAGSPPSGFAQPAYSESALINIKNLLLNIARYLRPFGGTLPTYIE